MRGQKDGYLHTYIFSFVSHYTQPRSPSPPSQVCLGGWIRLVRPCVEITSVDLGL